MALTPPIAFCRFIWDTAEILYVCHRSNHGKALKTNLQTIYERDAARLKVWFRLRYKNMHCILHRKKEGKDFFRKNFCLFHHLKVDLWGVPCYGKEIEKAFSSMCQKPQHNPVCFTKNWIVMSRWENKYLWMGQPARYRSEAINFRCSPTLKQPSLEDRL